MASAARGLTAEVTTRHPHLNPTVISEVHHPRNRPVSSGTHRQPSQPANSVTHRRRPSRRASSEARHPRSHQPVSSAAHHPRLRRPVSTEAEVAAGIARPVHHRVAAVAVRPAAAATVVATLMAEAAIMVAIS